MSLYEYIIRVENTHRKRISLEREEEMLTTPLIRNNNQISEIYGIFADELTKRNIKLDSIESRRIFIFIIMRLCYPAVFTGAKLKRGIRDQMATVLNCEASVISHDFKNLTFHYKRYRGFRQSVDEIYEAIMDTLSEK